MMKLRSTPSRTFTHVRDAKGRVKKSMFELLPEDLELAVGGQGVISGATGPTTGGCGGG